MTASSSLALVQNTQNVASRQANLWWPGLLGALALLLLEIAVRKLAVPERWQVRFQRLREPRSSEDRHPSYDELVAQIEQARTEHLRAIRAYTRYQPDNAAARARLYVSRKSNR